MNLVFRVLSLMLCLELIVAPFNAELSFIGQNAFAQQSCAKGMSYDSTLNRCLTTVETANVMNATASCAQGDVQCYKTNAQQAFQEKVNKGDAPERKESGGFVSSVANIAAIAGPVSIAALGLSTVKASCASTSFWTMVGASAALIIGDNLANFQHKKRLKQIKEDWGKIVNPEQANGDKDKERSSSLEAQSQAFEMLARSEDSLVSAAKMKKNFFMIAGIAYAAAGILAYREVSQEVAGAPLVMASAVNTCTPLASNKTYQSTNQLYVDYTRTKDSAFKNFSQFQYNLKTSKDLASLLMNQVAMEKKFSSPTLDEYERIKNSLLSSNLDQSGFEAFKKFSLTFIINLSPLQLASAQTSNIQTNAAKSFKEDDGKSSNLLLNAGLGVAAGVALKASAAVRTQIVKPMTRAIFSGVMSGMSLIMASHAGSQAEASQKRADLLRKMKEDFVSASGALNACKSEDRSDPAKPNCYCYTADNQRNSNRTSSQVCQKLWTGVNAVAGNYTNGTGSSSKICITKTNQPDAACACKINNTCMKVTPGNLSGLSAGTMSMLNSALEPLNKIANGTADGATIDSGSLSNQAMNMQKALKQLDKINDQKGLIKDKSKQEAALTASLNNASSGMNPDNMLGTTSSSGMPSSPGEAAVQLEKELNELHSTTNSGAETVIGGNAPVAAPELEFGLTADQAAAQETQIAEVMKENLDYGSNDIGQGSKANIFEVLSNRYQRSGMRRLFDEKGITQPEKAATTDINQ